ncbi:MAG: nucleoside triphosphate pyrophosphohydrolase [Gemmatimonadetes bacterium]|nr:nucleoside triphosphate pyrophosphohydrolase [Gemmatimonadota bacterium]
MKNDHEAVLDDDARHLERSASGDDSLGRALALVRFLRHHCPWDAAQTPASLRPYLLEEANETADAIASGDDEALRGELGDLLLNVAFQIVLAEERGTFGATGVVAAIERKMERRHPHVYGDAEEPPDWEALKAEERAAAGREAGSSDPFEGIPGGLDPLSRAARAQERMAAFGFDWPDLSGPLDKVREEIAELEAAAGDGRARRIGEADERVEDEVGDLLFAVVNASRVAGAHPANALLGSVAKFERRCRRMIELAEARDIEWRSAGLWTLDELWEDVKREE